MNKFTRSQMGKIMAYALSAAMAVTVVPTYMMKPLTVMAAVTPSAKSVAQGEILYNNGVADGDKVYLYSKSKAEKPDYTLEATDYDEDTSTYEIVVPYSVPIGKYYATTTEENFDIATDSTAKLIEVTAGSKPSSVSLAATNTNIYYFGDSDYKSNTEKINVNLKGAEDATVLAVVAESSASTSIFDDLTYNPESKSIDVKVKSDATIQDDTELTETITVTVYVAGRERPYTKDIEVTAVKGTALVANDIKLTADNQVVTANDEVHITTSKPVASQEKVKYTVTQTTGANGQTASGITEGNTVDDVAEVKKTDKVIATYDASTGIFKASEAGVFTITPSGNANTAASNPITIKVINPSIKTVGDKVGVNDGDIAVDGYLPGNAFVSYTVEDPSIATISGTSVSNSKVTFIKPGVTKVTATITVPDDKFYTFETTGYIVTAPKDTKDFDVLSIANTEAYVNALRDVDTGNLFTPELAAQVADGIISGSINAKALTAEVYADAEAELEDKYEDYYYVEGTSSDVTADGLLFATYDPEVTNVEDPESLVNVKFVKSGLQAKDEQFKQKNSVVDFVAEATVDNEVVELNQPVWLTVTKADTVLIPGKKYTVYDNGVAIYTAEAKAGQSSDATLTFQTDSFSVFSIVQDDDAEITDNSSKIDDVKPDSEDIYDLVNFSAHVQRRIGTDDEADIAATVSDDGIISLGTHGQSRRVEKITLTGLDADEVEMTAHVQKRVDHPEDVADLTQVVNEDGSISIGTEHQSRRIEAFSMNLKGDLAEKYDVYYRVHAQNYGWLGWAKNGEIAGTSGHSFRLEGIEIIFVEKGTEFDESQYVKTPEEGDRGYSEKAAYMDRVVSEK